VEAELKIHSRPARRLVATTLLAALAVLVFAVASARAGVPRSFFGVAPQTPLGSADFDRMGRGKVGTLRILVNWGSIDPSSAAGDDNWSTIDPIVAGAARNGVEVLPFLFGTPQWVAEGLDGHSCGSGCGIFAPSSSGALDAWANFVGAAVARYGPNGDFWAENPTLPKVPIDAWQIWNEQNSSSFYKPKPRPKSYAKLLKAAHDAIRARDGSADIVLGGMAQLSGSKKATPASKYLKKLYKVQGVKKSFDGVAAHPYGAKLKATVETVDLFRAAMKKGHDSGADLWITEIGAGSKKGGNPLNRGTKGQAKLLKDTFKYFKKKRRKLNVKNVDWFSWMDSSTSICAWCSSSGLFKSGLVEKPSWRAFTKFTGGS
jgi:hypothetical protein